MVCMATKNGSVSSGSYKQMVIEIVMHIGAAGENCEWCQLRHRAKMLGGVRAATMDNNA